MPLAQFDFYADAGGDWQRQLRLRDTNTWSLVPLQGALMEIRNTNYILVLRLDATSGRCVILEDGCTISLHISAEDSYYYFHSGNYPGAIQAVGVWGIGRAYIYDIFVVDATGTQTRVMRGFFYVDPNISQPVANNVDPMLTIGQRGNY